MSYKINILNSVKQVNIASVVLGFKLSSVTGYCSLFTIGRDLLSSALSTATYEALWLEKNVLLSLKNMKNYYNFMFFSTVCSSFTESERMLQKLEGPIKWLGICQTLQKLLEFCETRIRKKVINVPTQKNRIWPIFKL